MHHRNAEFEFEAANGLPVRVFRLKPGDGRYLVDLFEHLSATSRYLRFNEYLSNVDPATVLREAEHLSLVDPDQGVALLAFADLPDQPNAAVAGARFILTGQPGEAEVSIAVRDDLHHMGIGRQLLLYLAEVASDADVSRLVASFHTGNRRIWALLAEAPYLSETIRSGRIYNCRNRSEDPARTGRTPVRGIRLTNQTTKETTMHREPVYTFEAREGLTVRVYLSATGDTPALQQLFASAAPEHRLAFQHPVAEGAPEVAVAEMIGQYWWFAVSGSDNEEPIPVAVAGFELTSATEAQIAVVVRDDMQGRGIGSRLLYYMLDQARATGVRRARTSFESSNEAAWQVLQYSPYHVTWQPSGKRVDMVLHLHARTSSGTTMN